MSLSDGAVNWSAVAVLSPLSRLTADALVEVRRSALLGELEPGQDLFRRGSDDAFDYFLLDGTLDLVACACSLHWFDLPRFYENAARALKPGGIIAAWTYDWPWTGAPALDAVLEMLKTDILGPFWGENAVYYFSGYQTLPFPFPARRAPSFTTPIAESAADLTRFLSTWSAVQKYRERNGADPLALVDKALGAAWRRSPPALPLRVPLHLRCGHKAL